MGEISVLRKDISELIAAGEVIERPSSIIKELVENSVDSGANVITVEIKNGGVTYMRVTDNGSGISKEDVSTAFLRHATSKIKSREDLSNILTLGFRGEALASIAAVSKVEVLTKVSGEQYGTRYRIDGSEEKIFEKSGCPDGTTMIVRDIFYNVPARLKFLKKDVTEGNAIAAIVNKLALSRPDISFKFIRDNKQELFTPGDNDIYSAIYGVYGKVFADTLISVDYSSGGIKVTGYTVKPVYSRANRSFQNFFVNNRFIKSMTCTYSLEESYKNIIMTGKFPACVLNIALPPDTVDVNVHPAKIEVRFSDEKIIFDSVYFAVKNALLSFDKPKELEIVEKPSVLESQSFDMSVEEVKTEQVKFKTLLDKEEKTEEQKEENCIEKFKQPEERSLDSFKFIKKDSFVRQSKEEETNTPEKKEVKEDKLPIKIIGEAFETYIIAQAGKELILIDKHAAHERILFEKLKANETDFDSQMLMPSETLLLTEDEYEAARENQKILLHLGFNIEYKENNNVDIIGMPPYLDKSEIKDAVAEIAVNLLNYKRNPAPEILDDLLHSIACKSAIKANDKSDIKELTALAEQVYYDDRIRYCPHGRPVIIVLMEKDLEKQFKRIV